MLGRAPLALITTRIRVAAGPPVRLDPIPVVSHRATLGLDVLLPDGTAQPVGFRVDTGAGVTQMGVKQAEKIGLRVTGRRGELPVSTVRGDAWEPVIVGAIRVRFPGTVRVFLWDCLFFPDRAEDSPALLGLKDVFEAVRLTFDRVKSPDALYGSLVFDEYPPATSP